MDNGDAIHIVMACATGATEDHMVTTASRAGPCVEWGYRSR